MKGKLIMRLLPKPVIRWIIDGDEDDADLGTGNPDRKRDPEKK